MDSGGPKEPCNRWGLGSLNVKYRNIWHVKGKGSPYSITEHRVPELIPVLGSQTASDVSHKLGGRLPLLSARPAVTLATHKKGCYQFRCLVNRGTMGVNTLPKTVTRQCRGCNLNPGPSVPESSMLTIRLLSHPSGMSQSYLLGGSSDVAVHCQYRSNIDR